MVSTKVYDYLDTKIFGLKKFERRERDYNQRKVYDEVFDHITLLNLYKLFHQDVVSSIDFPISSGKEANIFKGTSPHGDAIAIKIFRVVNATFKHFTTYIVGDPRFKHTKRDHRGIVYTWTRKEYKNLLRLSDAGVRVPKPLGCQENILLMEYIGGLRTPAPMLKDVELKSPERKFKSLVRALRKMYKVAKLVHGDFSEYNILVHRDKLVIIDVGQAVVLAHPMAQELLVRDVDNLVRYFRKLGVDTTAEEVLGAVTR
jgi:RIO kinase 1